MAHVFALMDVLRDRQVADRPYFEFLRERSMSVGIYHLAPGVADDQQPHEEDELYYVLAGRGKVDIDGGVAAVEPGDVVFVEKGARHHFFDYSEGLTLLVVFAPPYSGRSGA